MNPCPRGSHRAHVEGADGMMVVDRNFRVALWNRKTSTRVLLCRNSSKTYSLVIDSVRSKSSFRTGPGAGGKSRAWAFVLRNHANGGAGQVRSSSLKPATRLNTTKSFKTISRQGPSYKSGRDTHSSARPSAGQHDISLADDSIASLAGLPRVHRIHRRQRSDAQDAQGES